MHGSYNIPSPTANITMIVRPDNTFLATERSGFMYVGNTSLLGPYTVPGPSVWPKIAGLNNGNAEDPVLWYSGGYYHITVNWWDARVAHHLMSKDGVTNWKDMGVAYDPRASFIRYTDGTVNKWNNLERPGVLIENGHVTHFTFAATDIDKSSITGSDNHGSKIIVIPFDGVAFDADNGGVTTGLGGAGGSAGSGTAGHGGGSPGGGAGGTAGSAGGAAATGSGGSGGNPSVGGIGGGGAPGGVDPGTGGATGPTGGGTGAGGSGPASGGAAGSPHGASGGQTDTVASSSGDTGCACSLSSAGGSPSPGWLLFLSVAAWGALCRARRRSRR